MAAANRIWNEQRPPPDKVVARPRVCVVNDDRAVLGSLRFVFEAANCEVRAFTSGRGLLASPAARGADCFVLDHRPRGPDGLKLARRLRSLGYSGPIVLTTGFRCAPLETMASSVEGVIPTGSLDEELIQSLLAKISETRARPPEHSLGADP